MLVLTYADVLAAALVVIALVVLVIAYFSARNVPFANLRRTEAYQVAEALMHEAAEKGQRNVLALGGSTSGEPGTLSGLAGMPAWRALARRSVFNDYRATANAGDGNLALLAQMVARGEYEDALAPELFLPEHALLVGTSPSAYLAGLLPEVNQPGNSGLMMSGTFAPSAAIALDLANRKGLQSMAATDSLSAQAAFFASGAPLALGEDYYAPGAVLQTHPGATAQLRAQDVLRVLLILGLVVGAALKMAGVLP